MHEYVDTLPFYEKPTWLAMLQDEHVADGYTGTKGTLYSNRRTDVEHPPWRTRLSVLLTSAMILTLEGLALDV